MDLRLIEYFVAVADQGGISRGAESLLISQPSVSQAIRKLEAEVGRPLFDRSGPRLVLNPAGQALREAASRVLSDIDLARTRMRAVRSRHAGRLEVAALGTLAVDTLPTYIAKFCARYPDIVVSVTSPGGPADVLNAVRVGRAEIGLTTLPPSLGVLQAHPVASEEIVIVMPPELADEHPDPFPLANLGKIDLIVDPADVPVGQLLLEHAGMGAGEACIECVHPQAIIELVSHGAGAALMPRGLAEDALGRVAVRSTTPATWREVSLVLRPGPLSPAAQGFFEVAFEGDVTDRG